VFRGGLSAVRRPGKLPSSSTEIARSRLKRPSFQAVKEGKDILLSAAPKLADIQGNRGKA